MIEFRLPPGYNYCLSLSFAYPRPEPAPELWNPNRKLFIFPVKDEVIVTHFKGNVAYIETNLSARKAISYVVSKLNIDSYGLKSMHKGLSIAKEIGLLNKYPHIDGFIPPKLGDPPNLLYSGLIKTIIMQMISYTVARKMMSKFVRAFGKTLTYKGNIFHAFPEPEIVYESSEKVIKEKATVSMAKAKAIREVAKLELENMLKDIEAIAWRNPHEAARELMKIKGIGYWTAYVSLMAGLGIWHAQPIDRLITSLNRAGINCYKSVFEESPSAAGYISVAILFGEEALRGRYFKVDECEGT